MTDNELMNCPFCGGDAVVEAMEDGGYATPHPTKERITHARQTSV